MFLHSFWTVRDGVILHHWNWDNYLTLFKKSALCPSPVPHHAQSLPRSQFFLYFSATRSRISYPCRPATQRTSYTNWVIVPLWVSYLVRGYAWKTILGSDGVLNGFLQYLHITHGPVSALLYSPFAVVLMLTHIYNAICLSFRSTPRSNIYLRPLIEASQDLVRIAAQDFPPRNPPALFSRTARGRNLRLRSLTRRLSTHRSWSAVRSGTMIANLVQSLFGAAYDWPLGAAISVFILIITLSLLALTQRAEKRWSFE